jgi:OFA family oxalate/formate antiporter-like MFS transporter
MIAFGGVMIAVAWIVNSAAASLGMLYLGAVLSGIGAGAIYATCVGNAVKWFPDHRGLAVGLTAAGFGAGAALTVVPIREVIAAYGYEAAFFWFGLAQGAVVFVIAWVLRAPYAGETPTGVAPKVIQSTESFTPQQMLATPVFWVMYVMFLLVAASGLMATAQVALIARDFNVANVAVLGAATTLTVALLVDNVFNGLARPLFGWVSDHIGRENTMAFAFFLGGISYWLLGSLGTTPWAFIVFAGLIFLTWGEIYSLFPSTCTDSFGPQYATTNLSFLYTAKGVAAFLVPLANLIKAATGSWHMVFVVTAILNFVVVAMALFVLKPLRSRRLRMGARHLTAGAR